MRMTEGLRNIGPTFCRMMKAALKDQVGRNVFSCVDGIVVAGKKKASYISDLIETFTNMREAKLKLNPDKCIFRVTWGKVLGCLVSTKGIEVSTDKIKVILHMPLPQTRKEVQKLVGRIAALNRFIVKLAEKSLPLFCVLQGSTKVEWGQSTRRLLMI
jgi:F420-0:gamma-glutamyl ligase-like protein